MIMRQVRKFAWTLVANEHCQSIGSNKLDAKFEALNGLKSTIFSWK
jgi:hypothetical protein